MNCERLRTLGCYDSDAEALSSVVRQVALSSSLQSLKVSHNSFPPCLDLSLSECARHKNAIIDYKLCALQGHAVERGILVPKQRSIPKFVKALNTNYTIQKVTLEPIRPEKPDPWDFDFRTNIDALIHLNVAGRGSAVMDPSNRHKSIDVLNQGSEDLDCIFIHLRENPLICEGQPLSAGRKRSIATQLRPSRRVRLNEG